MSEKKDLSGLVNFCRKQKERWENPKTEGEKLRNRIMFTKFKSNDEALELEKEVHTFFQSGASDEDKRLLVGYTETLAMICSAIREGRLNIGKENSNGQL